MLAETVQLVLLAFATPLPPLLVMELPQASPVLAAPPPSLPSSFKLNDCVMSAAQMVVVVVEAGRGAGAVLPAAGARAASARATWC